MTHPELIERITRSLAYMLRHQPEQFDLELDEYGFADMEDVIQALNERLGEPVEDEDVRTAVESGDRIRYEIAANRIRALYGHSIEVKPGESAKPPTLLYVGVSQGDAERAHKYGLRPGRRSFLHLALNPDDALETGRRASRDYVVITVNALDAWEEGINFYDRKSLFLSDPIPTHFLQVGDVHTDGYAPVEGERSHGSESGGPPPGRGRPRDDRGGRGGRGRGQRGGRSGRGGFDRPHESDPTRRHSGGGDEGSRGAPRHAEPHGSPSHRSDAAPVGADRRDARPAFDDGGGRHTHDEGHGRHPTDVGHGRQGSAGPGRGRQVSEGGQGRHGESGPGRRADAGHDRHANAGHDRPAGGGHDRHSNAGDDRHATAGHDRPAEVGHGRHEPRSSDDRRGRPDSRPPQRDFQDDRGRPRGNGGSRDGARSDAPRRDDRPMRDDRPARDDRPMRDDRAPAERSGAPERSPRPAPANESGGGGGFGLGVFEPKAASVRPSAPLPREKPAAEKPRETPRPQRDEGGSFGAGIE